MSFAVLDTNIYIGHWELGLYENILEVVRRSFIVRHSAVVLSELRRGARSRAAQQLVTKLHGLAHVQWAPSAKDWWEAGRLVREIADRQGWDKNKRRDFQNDTLIALTVRSHGATLVTANIDDFALLAGEVTFRLLPAE